MTSFSAFRIFNQSLMSNHNKYFFHLLLLFFPNLIYFNKKSLCKFGIRLNLHSWKNLVNGTCSKVKGILGYTRGLDRSMYLQSFFLSILIHLAWIFTWPNLEIENYLEIFNVFRRNILNGYIFFLWIENQLEHFCF